MTDIIPRRPGLSSPRRAARPHTTAALPRAPAPPPEQGDDGEVTSRVPAESRDDEPVDAMAARQLTGELQQAIHGAHQALAHLADRVRAAHRGRVWIALGHTGWGTYAEAELRMSRSQAYRLLEIATTLDTFNRAAASAGAMSPTGDTELALWDFGLSQRALRDVAGHADRIAEAIAAALTDDGPDRRADPDAVRDLVHQVVEAARHPAPPPQIPDTSKNFTDTDTDVDPADVASLRAVVDQLVAIQGRLGVLALEIAPAYLTDAQARDGGLDRLANDIGIEIEHLLAARHYAVTGDRRALEGTVL
ncbi:hypothetical protein [Streptacidiphilus sp. EB129]|uniref:hypothetical protein n=1 Tax=Streptacidiphilus sp. EB129 TaxID=3156262 RepID=UPI0035113225